jgi:hypothetical protein
MLLDTGRYGENVGVKNDVLRRESHFIDKHAVGALADLDFSLEAVCLALLVEGHDDRHAAP